MIVPNQQNIKVHFAGVEDIYQYSASLAGGVKYGLYTAFPFICEKALGVKHVHLHGGVINQIPKILSKNSNHIIQDSGLFTLMFGSYKGQKDKKTIDRWYGSLVDFTLQQPTNITTVEVDCQKILGTKEAWQYRRKLRNDLPNNRQINVFHLEDGQKGLDELIEFSEYLAISVPELRATKKKGYLTKLANYIKNKKPSIDIHLLGYTEVGGLGELNFCTSSDSTSWKSVLRYGEIQTAKNTSRKYANLNTDKLTHYERRIREFVEAHGLKQPTNKGYKNYSALAFQANQLKQLYSEKAGSQQ